MNYIKPFLGVLLSVYCSFLAAQVTDYFNKISKDSNLLYTFFKDMPKGGELHYHLAGGPYPETLLKWAARGDYCLNEHSFVVTKGTACKGIQSKALFKHPLFYLELVKNWSFKDFLPGDESGRDHFFNTFDKFLPLVADFSPELLANVIERAAKQKEQYLEIMILPDNGNATTFGDLIKEVKSFAQKKRILLSNKGFQQNLEKAVAESSRVLEMANRQLDCQNHPKALRCQIKVKFLYYVLREQPLENVFAQALSAFETAKRSSDVVGVNLVQAEDGPISLRDYREQMAIFRYFHQQYPGVHIALHAGELSKDLVDDKDLQFHIHDAVFVGHAERIGHGVDIKQEKDAEATVNYMAKHQIPVETNLVSNLKILNTAGPLHPLNYYLTHGVPVVLSTDDEGILRTDLTQQYVAAVLANGLNYPTLKQINRNTLTYSFLLGKSLWANPSQSERVRECQDLNSDRCLSFLKTSEKAAIQWQLEQKLIKFEKKY